MYVWHIQRSTEGSCQLGKAQEGGVDHLIVELPLLSARALFLVAVPVIVEDLVNQAADAGGPDDDEDLASYSAARMAAYLF